MKPRRTASVAFEKISVTLGERVFRQIRERTGDVEALAEAGQHIEIHELSDLGA